ncbi:TetR/AcrR family transcriptional regulator C-terminal domain-containing protein [Kribbella italica]|uniref:AcrR family transcriptional regulator n=1 Tax=Kribbella italica TaxID=1540520 RepID=A0A7W9MVT4_9ACTN|nr:TetR/AcrR family transcriptional regulator C-terminal domain-containing protein [Kribbella italica]MBB5837333.1 AcrR family transcriptional regulator [Kribbella italica]
MESIWTRQRTASPARETLSRDQIVKATMELLDAEGLAGLSMRKLAARLDSGATSLYWHVQTKDDLIDLVIDQVYGEVDVPDAELAGWRGGALLLAHSLRAVILRHGWLPEVIYIRPSIGPNAVVMGSRGLALFTAAGFTGRDIDYAMNAVLSFVFGNVSPHATWQATVRRSGYSVEELNREILAEVAQLPAMDPMMHESVQRRRVVDMDQLLNESFSYGLDSLLDGLEKRLST